MVVLPGIRLRMSTLAQVRLSIRPSFLRPFPAFFVSGIHRRSFGHNDGIYFDNLSISARSSFAWSRSGALSDIPFIALFIDVS